MAAETNLTKSTDLAPAITIDVLNKFEGNFKSLQDLLGVTEVFKIREGMLIKRQSSANVTLAGGVVNEGDVIPLSQVVIEPAEPVEVVLKKYRKATTAEAIGRVGYDTAVNQTDQALIKEIQRGIRSDLLTYLGTGTGTATGDNLQGALAQAMGQLGVKFEDENAQSVAFINPLDLADYQATANITLQTAFGLTYLQNFLGFERVIVLSSVPKGTVYATAIDNLKLYAIDMNSSEVARAFNMRADQFGLIGMTHYLTQERAQHETLILSGIYIVAERLDGVVKATITPGV